MMNNFTRLEKVVVVCATAICIFILLLRTCSPVKPQPVKSITKEIHDTTLVKIGPDTIIINNNIPVVRLVYPIADTPVAFGEQHDTSYNAYTQGYKDASEALSRMRHTCRDTVYYNDTIVKDNWRLYLSEWLTQNRIIKRVPIVTTTVTYIKDSSITTLPPKLEHIKFYGGINLLINTNYLNRWDIGPSGILTIPQGWAFSYTYGLHNNTHTIGAYGLIKFFNHKN